MEAVHGFRQPTEVDIAIGKKIRKLRQRGKMSLNDLAGKIGISYQQLQKYETGVNRITAGMLVNLSEALGYPITVFFDLAPVSGLAPEDVATENMRKRCGDLIEDIEDPEILSLITGVVERLHASH